MGLIVTGINVRDRRPGWREREDLSKVMQTKTGGSGLSRLAFPRCVTLGNLSLSVLPAPPCKMRAAIAPPSGSCWNRAWQLGDLEEGSFFSPSPFRPQTYSLGWTGCGCIWFRSSCPVEFFLSFYSLAPSHDVHRPSVDGISILPCFGRFSC